MSDVDPSRLVADADVLAADLLVGGSARDALDHVRCHDWMTLVASDKLLADARTIIAALADDELAALWRKRVTDERVAVSHPVEDHPALACAYQGNAAHLLSLDETLTSAAANRSLQSHLSVSIRPPDAFTRLFDAASLYETLHNEPYPGPDRNPRA